MVIVNIGIDIIRSTVTVVYGRNYVIINICSEITEKQYCGGGDGPGIVCIVDECFNIVGCITAHFSQCRHISKDTLFIPESGN